MLDLVNLFKNHAV